MTRTARRRAGWVALAVLTVAACGADEEAGGSAACEAARLRVEPATVARAEELTVSGTAFTDGCADTCHVDDDTGEQVCETAVPHRAITVELVPDDGPSVTLVDVDADEEGAFTVGVTVPADAPEGRGLVVADVGGAEPVEVTIAP